MQRTNKQTYYYVFNIGYTEFTAQGRILLPASIQFHQAQWISLTWSVRPIETGELHLLLEDWPLNWAANPPPCRGVHGLWAAPFLPPKIPSLQPICWSIWPRHWLYNYTLQHCSTLYWTLYCTLILPLGWCWHFSVKSTT